MGNRRPSTSRISPSRTRTGSRHCAVCGARASSSRGPRDSWRRSLESTMVRTETLAKDDARADQLDDGRMAALMARYCAGEITAFHELYSALAPRILGYLTGLAGDRPTAEDLLQQTFMKLHEARSAYVKGANPVPWLYTIAHRTCLDEIRRRKRARVRVSLDGQLPYEPSVD